MSERALFRCGHCGATVLKSERPTMGPKAFAKLRYCSPQCSGGFRRTDAFARFHASYEIADNGCWIWTKARTPSGYGNFWTGSGFARAHRWSYEQGNGDLGSAVCRHKCDTPSCVNPAHLEAGTQADNQADAKSRGRTARGERQGAAKLTEAKVRAIRANEGKLADIAREFGIAQSTASQIRSGHRWRHVV